MHCPVDVHTLLRKPRQFMVLCLTRLCLTQPQMDTPSVNHALRDIKAPADDVFQQSLPRVSPLIDLMLDRCWLVESCMVAAVILYQWSTSQCTSMNSML